MLDNINQNCVKIKEIYVSKLKEFKRYVIIKIHLHFNA
ncbi:hypothetical protein FM106_00895 [Brachybacterium faecium]|nr:hypothetical protein FM106_00895 [Brachybacterium faecium]